MTTQINIEGVKKIADTFAMLAEQFPDENDAVRMAATFIKRPAGQTAGCGTFACHAGWFAFAQIEGSAPGTWDPRSPYFPGMERYVDRDGNTVGFAQGALWMAITAGFTRDGPMTPAEALEQWANDHPDLWGNEHGRSMFNSPSAFLSYEEQEQNAFMSLRTVAIHWEGVYERLCAATAAKWSCGWYATP